MRGNAEVKGMLKNKFGRRIAGRAAAALVCAVAAAPAFAAEKAKTSQFCASEGDLAALNARVLQTELMVAALSCDERQRYNNFITSYQSVLNSRSQALQGMFKRAHGAQGMNRLNAFVTKMANDSSQQVREKGSDYCTYAGELFDEVLATNPSELNRVTSKPWIVGRHGYRPCVLEASRKQTG